MNGGGGCLGVLTVIVVALLVFIGAQVESMSSGTSVEATAAPVIVGSPAP